MRRIAVIIAWTTLGLGCTERLLLPGGLQDGGGGEVPILPGQGEGDGDSGSLGGSPGQDGRDAHPAPCNHGLLISVNRAELLLTVSRNLDMLAPFGDLTRISAVEEKLRPLVAAYHNAIDFGYQEFPSGGPSCSNFCCVSDMDYIQPGMKTAEGIDAVLRKCDPRLSTNQCASGSNSRPVANALNSAMRIFQMDDGGERDVVLLVDGSPGCPSDSTNPSCPAQDVANQLANNNVKTHVVAIGPDAIASNCLKNIVVQSGTGPSTPPNPPSVYPANDPVQLEAILGQIITKAAIPYCTIELDSTPQDPDKVTVFIPNQMIPRDLNGQEGWNYVDNSRFRVIRFHGKACQQVQMVQMSDIGVCP